MVLKLVFTWSPVTYWVVHFLGFDNSYGLCIEEDSEPSYNIAIANLGASTLSDGKDFSWLSYFFKFSEFRTLPEETSRLLRFPQFSDNQEQCKTEVLVKYLELWSGNVNVACISPAKTELLRAVVTVSPGWHDSLLEAAHWGFGRRHGRFAISHGGASYLLLLKRSHCPYEVLYPGPGHDHKSLHQSILALTLMLYLPQVPSEIVLPRSSLVININPIWSILNQTNWSRSSGRNRGSNYRIY